MKKILTILAALVVTVSAVGQEVKSDLHKPLYLSFEIETNANLNLYSDGFKQALYPDELKYMEENDELEAFKKEILSKTGYDINAKFAVGYRVVPQFTVAAGFGGNVALNVNSNVETLSIPVFLRLRSDFLDKKVSPFVELDLGYAFMIKNTLAGPSSILQRNMDTGRVWFDKDFDVSYSEIWEGLDKNDKEGGIFEFPSGNTTYTNAYNLIRNGLFGELTIGVGFGLKNGCRLNIGASCGLAQCFRGFLIANEDGETLEFCKMEYLRKVDIKTRKIAGIEQEYLQIKRDICFTAGEINNEPFLDRFHKTLSLKVGISF